MEYRAIDLHKNENQIRIVTESGEVLDRRIVTTRDRQPFTDRLADDAVSGRLARKVAFAGCGRGPSAPSVSRA